MVRAAATGTVDYGAADLLDPRWWRQHWWLLGELEREATVQGLTAMQRHETALLSHGSLESDDFDQIQKYSLKLAKTLKRLYQPWLQEKSTDELAAELRQKWIDKYGDPDDSETKRKIARTLAWFEEQDAKYGGR